MTSEAQTEESQLVVVGCCCSLSNLTGYCLSVCLLTSDHLMFFSISSFFSLSSRTVSVAKHQLHTNHRPHVQLPACIRLPTVSLSSRGRWDRNSLLCCWSEWCFILMIGNHQITQFKTEKQEKDFSPAILILITYIYMRLSFLFQFNAQF